MWYMWYTLLLVSCALVRAEGQEAPVPATTTRAPPLTLDRQIGELAWGTWLQSPESSNPNAPPRRITTKSLFITPLVCPKGQRLDRNGCVQVVTLNKDEHERILLEQLNALFTSAPGDVIYDYGDDEPGPLQLSIPINLDPQASPLQAQEPSAQAHDLQPNYVNIDKKDSDKPDGDASIEAELELLKLQNSQNPLNITDLSEGVLNHNVFNNILPLIDKPKRDSPVTNSDNAKPLNNTTDEGQKELVYGQVNIDPILLNTVYQNQNPPSTEITTEVPTEAPLADTTLIDNTSDENNSTNLNTHVNKTPNTTMHELKKGGLETKLNPENDYADIGEAIKLISRYAEVTTDDNFSKDKKKYATKDDNILGTRTRLQHRRNKQKPMQRLEETGFSNDNTMHPNIYKQKNVDIYRYSWPNQHPLPPNYPFRHVQDYWPGQSKIGGVYNTQHENPRRHHHSYPHNNFRPHSFPYLNQPGPYPGIQETYPGQLLAYPHKTPPIHSPIRSPTNNQDLYSLLGLRHWFSSESTSKR